jgi:hypothetical protein
MTARELVIVGAGPAGVSAALWAKSLHLDVLLLEGGEAAGGQLFHVHFHPRELPGLEAGDGRAIAATYARQLAEGGIPVRYGVRAESLETGPPVAVVLAGGERIDEESYLVAPTLFEGVADDAMLSREEVFGPVTSLYRFHTLDEAIERANAVEFGLSASIFTNSLEATQTFVKRLEAGLLHVNSQTAGADVHVPFGGIKGSGFGPHEQDRAALEFYTEVVTVYQDA